MYFAHRCALRTATVHSVTGVQNKNYHSILKIRKIDKNANLDVVRFGRLLFLVDLHDEQREAARLRRRRRLRAAAADRIIGS